MKKISIVLIIILLIGIWYYFVDTLTISEIVGNTLGDTAELVLGIFDFDTGLTRYDVFKLESKCKIWLTEIEEINNINNFKERNRRINKLMQEIIQDDAIKKILIKISPFGKDLILELVKAIGS